MLELFLISRVSLFILLGIMGLICLIIWGWQIRILRGKAIKNADGSNDSWHEQKTHYGIASPSGILVGLAFIVWTILNFDFCFAL